MRKWQVIFVSLVLILAISLVAVPACAPAEPEGTVWDAMFFLPLSGFDAEQFMKAVDKINGAAAGRLSINVLGGMEIIPGGPERGEALATGAMQFMGLTPDDYLSYAPEGQLMFHTKDTPMEARKSGYWDYQVERHKEGGIMLLARQDAGQHFDVWTNVNARNIREDWKGTKMQVSPHYDQIAVELGCATVSMPRSERYSAFEKGMMESLFGPPCLGKVNSYHEVVDYIVFPELYQSNIILAANLDAFNALPKDLQDLLVKTCEEFERESWEFYGKSNKECIDWLMTEGGMERLEYTGADAEYWLWANSVPQMNKILKQLPEHGPKIVELMGIELTPRPSGY